MDPLSIGSAAVSLLGGIGSFLANKTASERAAMLQDQQMQRWLELNIPDPAAQRMVAEKFVVQGVLDPKLESAIKSNPSEFNQIVQDSSYKAAQDRALNELSDLGYSGGLRLQDKAALQEAQTQAETQNAANRQSIMSEMARRGLGGSGFDIATRLAGQQQTADRLGRQSLQTAAQAQDRALQAIMNAGTLAGQMGQQDYARQAAKAQANDAINMFNTKNAQDVAQRNIAGQNQAQAMNLANAQNIANMNTQASNASQMYNNNLSQQNYQNQIAKLNGMQGVTNQQAGISQQQGQNTGNFLSNIGQGAGNALSSIANYNLLDNYFNKRNK